MTHRRFLFLAPVALVLFACSAQESLLLSQPNTAIQPVQQNAPWAAEWWGPRHAEKLELAKGADIELIMIGDSITHGWEDAGNEVWQQYYADRKAFNLGFSGDRTEHVLWRLQHGAVDGMRPKLVVIMIGTNNTGHSMDPAGHTADGIAHIVGELRDRLPEAKVLLLAIFPRHRSPYNEMRLRNEEINRLIADLADGKSVYFIDINDAFLDDDGALPLEVMPDELHPNAAGYALWAEAMEPTIRELLE
jgi:beta-glucosidase